LRWCRWICPTKPGWPQQPPTASCGTLRITSVPEPGQTRKYIEDALKMRADGNRFAFAVTDEATGTVLGTTSYHDILPAVKRVEIGYTWYARRCQRTHVNTTAKLLMMGHAFDTLGCHVVGWRTDNFNFASQAAIERLGAKKDGVIRGHALRRDGTIRDTVMYSMRAANGPKRKRSCCTCGTGRAPEPHEETAMLIDFFYTLRSAKLPVSVKEYLTLLEAIKQGVVGPTAMTATRSTTSIT
jgi:RimJ/RimL family protein N-acetyltransferase